MYLTEKGFYVNRPAFVSSHHYINRTRTATPDMGESVEGKTILRAGTVFPANDGTAEGIVFHDVDLSHGSNQPVAVMVEGYVYADRLPEAASAEAMEAMNEIKFEDYNATEEGEA